MYTADPPSPETVAPSAWRFFNGDVKNTRSASSETMIAADVVGTRARAGELE